jgi:Holliday junction resolvase RusA-like endonuclease
MNQVTITIPGKPIAKKRPRFARRGKFVAIYSDQHTEEGKWILTAREQIKERIPEGVPIILRCLFYMPFPKGMSKKKREAAVYHTKKPDLDNLVKFVKDCLNGELWHDDGQVAELYAGKIYNAIPRTYITVTW